VAMRSEAQCPAGISSLFEICKTNESGELLSDPLKIGARGGGFAILQGVRSRVLLRKSTSRRITVRINGIESDAVTTRWALKQLMAREALSLDLRVDLRIAVPIGAGYGTSAAGTAASLLAFADAMNLPITLNEIGRMTHVAEVINNTGLGTASAMLVGGFDLVTEPGAPGVGVVDRLLFPRNCSIICTFLAATPTKVLLTQHDIDRRVNPAGRKAMKAIRHEPRLATFLNEARQFSLKAGFQTPEISRIMNLMMTEGAIGVAQNMVGRAVHGVAHLDLAPEIAKHLRREYPSARVFVTNLDNRGVRLV